MTEYEHENFDFVIFTLEMIHRLLISLAPSIAQV